MSEETIRRFWSVWNLILQITYSATVSNHIIFVFRLRTSLCKFLYLIKSLDKLKEKACSLTVRHFLKLCCRKTACWPEWWKKIFCEVYGKEREKKNWIVCVPCWENYSFFFPKKKYGFHYLMKMSSAVLKIWNKRINS